MTELNNNGVQPNNELIMKQLARVEHHLATLEDKFRSQDHRFIAIEAANQEILLKLNNLTLALESLAAADQQGNQSALSLGQQQLSGNSSSNHNNNSNNHHHHNSHLQPHQHQHNLSQSRSNTNSTSSSISSSPSVSPIEPLSQHQSPHSLHGQSDLQQHQQHPQHQLHHQNQHQQQNQHSQQNHQDDNLSSANNSQANPLQSLYLNSASGANQNSVGAFGGTTGGQVGLQQQPNMAAVAASQFLAALNQLGDLEPRLLASTLGAAAAANVSVVDVATNLTKQQSVAAAVAAQQAAAAAAAAAAQQHQSAQGQPNATGNSNLPAVVHSIPHPHSHHAHPAASLLVNSPHYQTVRTKYSTRRYSRRRVGPEEAMADPAIRATVNLKMPTVPKTILIVLKHRLTVQTAITLACAQTGERLRKGAIQKKLEAMFREPGAVDSFLAEWDHSR